MNKIIGLIIVFSLIASTTQATFIGDKDEHILNITPEGAADVMLSDQTTPPLIVNFNKVTNTTALTNAAVLDSRTIVVDDPTGFIDHAFIAITNIEENRYTTFHQVGVASGNTITLDSPLDFAYPAGSVITAGTDHLNVNGSVTPQIFSVRAPDPGIPVIVDITRLIFHCVTDSAVDLTMFADIAGGITNGLVLRRVDGTYSNIFNVKTNHEIAGIMYDWTVYESGNPQQGADGFISRLTFGGQSKMGVVIRIGPGEDLQLIVQDDLSSITTLHVTAEGHVVIEE